jgi:hypothetical protein
MPAAAVPVIVMSAMSSERRVEIVDEVGVLGGNKEGVDSEECWKEWVGVTNPREFYSSSAIHSNGG